MDNSQQRRYGTVSFQAEQERKEQVRKNNLKFVPTVELPEGWSFLKLPTDVPYVKIDILPFLTETANGVFPVSHYDYYIHRNIGERRTSVVCPNRLKGLPCPICERLRGAWNTPEGKELYSMQKLQRRTLYAVKWLDAPDNLRGRILIYDAAHYSFGRFIEEKIETRDVSDPEEAAWDKYCDPYEGSTLKINLQKGTWEGHPFAKVTSIEFKKREQQYTEDIYDEVPDLSKFVNILSSEKLAELYAGGTNSNPDVESDLPFDRKPAFNLEAGYNPLPTAEKKSNVFVTNVNAESADEATESNDELVTHKDSSERDDSLRDSIYNDEPIESSSDDSQGLTEEGMSAF